MRNARPSFRALLVTLGLSLVIVGIWRSSLPEWLDVLRSETPTTSVIEVLIQQELQGTKPKYYCDDIEDGGARASCLSELVFGQREMSSYTEGGKFRCEGDFRDPDCARRISGARNFIWRHWKKRKRGHVAVVTHLDNVESTSHFFIEPNRDGTWSVDVRTSPMRDRADTAEPRLGRIVDVRWYQATADDSQDGLVPGLPYLKLSSISEDYLLL